MDAFITPELYRMQTHGPSPRGHLCLMFCRAGMAMAQDIEAHYNGQLRKAGSKEKVKTVNLNSSSFPDTEIEIKHIDQTLREHDVFIVQQLFNPCYTDNTGRNLSINDNLMELWLAIEACRRLSVNAVTAVLPYHAYGRQDKQDYAKRQPISARLVADIFELAAGSHIRANLLTCTLHSAQIKGFYSISVDEIDMLKPMMDVFGFLTGADDVIIVAPDAGAVKISQLFSRFTQIDLAISNKARKSSEETEPIGIVGDFKGKKRVLIVDDMISTAGSIVSLLKEIYTTYGYEEAYIGCTHGLLTGPAKERLKELHEKYRLKQLVITDTIPQPPELLKELPFLKIHSVVPYLSQAINRIHYGVSLSEDTLKSMKKR
ncbi:MAG: ribose-phosphate diphosphokinase [Nanoarchaeota archaeon]